MDTPPTSDAQEKIDFFLVAAHELRTSLSAMKWLFAMLLDGDLGSLTETQLAMISQAKASNERMITLVNDTMTVIRTDGASVPYLSLPVSLNTLVDESIKDFTNEASRKGIHIRYTPPASAVVIIGDADKLRIAIHNLFENAIKYGDADTDISVTLEIAGGNAVLTVADHGAIIPEKEQPLIFGKFFRASTTKDAYAGIGLGLYASRHIVERHRGTLSFTSSEASGTVFTLSIPLG